MILITDSTVTGGENPPAFRHIADLSFAENGDLYGSRLTLAAACRNLRKHIGASIPEVFCMASRNPARVIGLGDEIGTIAVGKRADLVFVDDDFGVRRVICGGEPI